VGFVYFTIYTIYVTAQLEIQGSFQITPPSEGRGNLTKGPEGPNFQGNF